LSSGHPDGVRFSGASVQKRYRSNTESLCKTLYIEITSFSVFLSYGKQEAIQEARTLIILSVMRIKMWKIPDRAAVQQSFLIYLIQV
jgi:hypothetical protein